MLLRQEPKHFPFNGYPTSDGKPMAETDHHRKLMLTLIESLELHYIPEPDVYVSGNLLLFYEKGNKRRHVAPDVFMVRGVEKGLRPNYLMWEEKTPDVVIELTSKSTRSEDTKKKWLLYEKTLKVKEYFLFDPYEDYLTPSFQGYRRVRGKFRPIEFIEDRLASEQLGLYLERDEIQLRLRDPKTGARIPTPQEIAATAVAHADQMQQRAEEQQARAEDERQRAEVERQRAEDERQRADRAEAELLRLREQIAHASGHRNGK